MLSAMPLHVLAQAEAAHSRRADPLDAQASVPPLRYQSTLQTYRPYADSEVSDWKQLNENTGRIGGWRTYAKQAREPDAAQAKPAGKELAAPVKPATPEHSGHTGHDK
ncbi:hypothetical protein GCM10011396_08120 [Undibacterium terreum]|uniref:Uncharacterized protein n=2 Tax=Undibacterium terreum TaxID=1224302 RepID=A0A916U8N1_9BURK|nr:hypothetical protein GCM10011396_08120 [Undibacterium terreum]